MIIQIVNIFHGNCPSKPDGADNPIMNFLEEFRSKGRIQLYKCGACGFTVGINPFSMDDQLSDRLE